MNKDTHDHTKCLELFERLSEYIDKELDDVSCSEIEKHLAHCEPCHVCLSSLKRTIELCKQLDEQPVPSAFSLRLKNMIQELS